MKIQNVNLKYIFTITYLLILLFEIIEKFYLKFKDFLHQRKRTKLHNILM